MKSLQKSALCCRYVHITINKSASSLVSASTLSANSLFQDAAPAGVAPTVRELNPDLSAHGELREAECSSWWIRLSADFPYDVVGKNVEISFSLCIRNQGLSDRVWSPCLISHLQIKKSLSC
jgi:hypothetical protein